MLGWVRNCVCVRVYTSDDVTRHPIKYRSAMTVFRGGRRDGRTEGRADRGTGRRWDGRTEGRVDGGTGGQRDGRTDGRTDRGTGGRGDGGRRDRQQEGRADGGTGGGMGKKGLKGNA
jgi:hypothetical protein